MPVATLMNTRSSTSGRWACCSPSAMMLTSLSMSTGTSKARCTWAGTSNRSQPGMIGGLIARPVECSTGPGRPMPIAASSPTPRRWSASSSAITDSTQPSTCSGPVGHVEVLAALDEDGPGQVGERGAWRAWRRCRRPPPPGRRGSAPAARAGGRRWTPRRTAPPGRAAAASRPGRRWSSGPARSPPRAGRGSAAARRASSSKTSLVRTSRKSTTQRLPHVQQTTFADSRQKCVTRATVTP